MTRINKLTFPSHERDQLNKRSENLNLIAASCGLQQVEMGLRLPHYWKLEFNSLETTSDPHKIICLSLTSNDSAIEVYTQTGTCGIGKCQMPFTITWLSSVPLSHTTAAIASTLQCSLFQLYQYQTQTIIIKLVFSGFMLWFVCSYICWISSFKY